MKERMYKVEHVNFIIEDYPSSFYKILNHENILIKKFKEGTYWTNFKLIPHCDEYKTPTKVTIEFDAYIKIKHTRRYREACMLWSISTDDILAIVK